MLEDWNRLEKTIVHNRHHAKLMPLPPAPLDVSLYLLGFQDLKWYALCYHLSLNSNNVHPNLPSHKILSSIAWNFH